MPTAARAPLFSPGGTVTLTALKWSGTFVTVGSLAAATTVRAIVDGAGVVCAAAEAASTAAPSSSVPAVLNRVVASQFSGRSEHHTPSSGLLEPQALRVARTSRDRRRHPS